MRSKIPKIKKKVRAFLVGEEGKISKQSLLKTGAILSSIAVATILSSSRVAAEHCSCNHRSHGSHLNLSYSPDTATTNHSSHGSHGSHSSHGSHGSSY